MRILIGIVGIVIGIILAKVYNEIRYQRKYGRSQ